MNLSLESLQLSENGSENPSPDSKHQFKDFELIKIFDYHVKIITELDKTLLIWETYLSQDMDKHEWIKAESRASEFRARFTRNHLYSLRTETRAVTELKKSSDPDHLLKTLTRAYQTAATALTTFNAYSTVVGNLPVLDKIKDCANGIKILREISRDILEPIEKTLANDREQLENLCKAILDLPKIIFQLDPKKKHKMTPVIVKSSLDMYEPKLLKNWAKKTKLLAKLRHRKKSNIAANLNENEPDLKPSVVKASRKPIEHDGDVETAMEVYLPDCDSVFEKMEAKPKIKPETPTNVGLFLITSDTEPEPVAEPPIPENKKRERVLKISPEILQELFRFKIQISETENEQVNQEVTLISELSDAIINDMIEEVVAEIMDEGFLNQLIVQELTDMTNEL